VLPKDAAELVQLIESIGENTERIVVVRMPVKSFVCQLMQTVAFEKYKDLIAESNYDSVFRLSLLINGHCMLQKNEVIALTDAGSSNA